jgi:hypothetical protein
MKDGRDLRHTMPVILGSGLVLVGLGLFMVVFFALYPVLANPTATYDRWFAAEPGPVASTVETGPDAAFVWETLVTLGDDLAFMRVQIEDDSTAGDYPIASWRWDLGDGTTASGRRVTHDYAEAGRYQVRLVVEDIGGATSAAQGMLALSEGAVLFGSAGRIDQFLDANLTGGVGEAFGSLGDSIGGTLDGVAGSVGATARRGLVVTMFAVAALALITVAWRVARIGVMVLVESGAVGVSKTQRLGGSFRDHLRLVETDTQG